MKRKTVILEKPTGIGHNQLKEQFEELSSFVKKHWDVIYEGACRVKMIIKQKPGYPQKIEIHSNAYEGRETFYETILSESDGIIKGAGYVPDGTSPTEKELTNIIYDLNFLIRKAKEPLKSKIFVLIADTSK